jgi:hypothetical protein
MFFRRGNLITVPGFEHQTVQPVASWYTNYAIQVHTEDGSLQVKRKLSVSTLYVLTLSGVCRVGRFVFG